MDRKFSDGNPSIPANRSGFYTGIVVDPATGLPTISFQDLTRGAAVTFSGSAQTEAGGWGYVSAREGNDFDEGSTTITPPAATPTRKVSCAM